MDNQITQLQQVLFTFELYTVCQEASLSMEEDVLDFCTSYTGSNTMQNVKKVKLTKLIVEAQWVFAFCMQDFQIL